jgi:transcriptional regulator NrdR family protein
MPVLRPFGDPGCRNPRVRGGDFIRRRRQCGACEKRFTTYERPDVSFPAIAKKDGRRIDYERAKLLASFNLALRKRPVSTDQIDSAIERIEEKLLNLGLREVPSSRIRRAGDARAQEARQGRLHPLCQRLPQL